MSWQDVAAAQHGLVSRKQLLAFVTPAAVRWLVEDGRILPVRQGVYRVAGAPETMWSPLWAALLAAGDAVASHRAAAGLHGFPGVLPGAVELMVFGRTTPRLPGVLAHRADRLMADDVEVVEGIPATSRARTVIDLAGAVHPRLLERMLDQCDVAEVTACLDRVGTRGRRGVAWLLPLLRARVGGDSPLEQLWLRRLHRAGYPPPVLAHQLVAGGRLLILDFAWPEHRVGIEVDGWSSHSSRTQFDRDRERDLLATQAGWRILRVTSRTPVSKVTAALASIFAQKVS